MSATGGVNGTYSWGDPYALYGYGYGYPAYGYGYGSSLFGPYGFGDFGLYGGFLGGYGNYGFAPFDPGYGDVGVAYDPYSSSSNGTFVPTDSSGSSGASAESSKPGALRLEVWPLKTSVYVDGSYVGLVKQYDSFFRNLHLATGPHEVQLKADGYEPVTFHVRIEPGNTEVYRGEMNKLRR